jgi:hypothetical protein
MANPGCPQLKPYQYKKKYDWPERCDTLLTLRIPKSMKKAVDQGKAEGWQERVRRLLAEMIEESESEAEEEEAS